MEPTLRSGTVARLAGLSPSTLRIWEHRYGVVAPPRSAAGQRTYAMADVQRLRVIRQLTLDGHAIGTIAHLDADALALLGSGTGAVPTGRQRLAVVGAAMARKLGPRMRPDVVRVFDDLAHADRDTAACGAVDTLLVHVASLHASVADSVLALRAALPARALVVVYAFGAEATTDALRAAGATLRREPVTGRELARLLAASKPAPVVAAHAQASAVRASPRRYTDAELAALVEATSGVACECPRHLAEIVTMLVGFEAYSGECASVSADDAALHRHLHDVTAAARTMLERALAKVVVQEGLVV